MKDARSPGKYAGRASFFVVLLLVQIGAPPILMHMGGTMLRAQSPGSQANAPPGDVICSNGSTGMCVPPLEVVSVKQNKGAVSVSGMGVTGDGLVVTNVPLLFIIQTAFAGHFTNGMIAGLPGWEMTRYDIEGRVSMSELGLLRNSNQQQREKMLGAMLRAVLADRFQMKYRYINKVGPVYRLVVAKGGPKLKQAAPGQTGFLMNQRGIIRGPMTLGGFANALSGPITGRVVIDDTGLQGKYDVNLTWTPDFHNRGWEASEASASASAPSIFTAVKEQLGLRLESGKGPVKGVEIERIERPTPN